MPAPEFPELPSYQARMLSYMLQNLRGAIGQPEDRIDRETWFLHGYVLALRIPLHVQRRLYELVMNASSHARGGTPWPTRNKALLS